MVANFAGLPEADSLDAPDWAAFMAALTSAIQSNLVQSVASQAERDSRLAMAPTPTFAVSTGDGTCWLKTGNGWVTVFAPPGGWQDVSLDSGYQVGNQACRVRTYTAGGLKFATMEGRVTHSPSGFASGGLRLGAVPAGAVPADRHDDGVGITTTGSNVSGTCRLEVAPATGYHTIDAGPGAITIWVDQGQTATDWVSINTNWLVSP